MAGNSTITLFIEKCASAYHVVVVENKEEQGDFFGMNKKDMINKIIGPVMEGKGFTLTRCKYGVFEWKKRSKVLTRVL